MVDIRELIVQALLADAELSGLGISGPDKLIQRNSIVPEQAPTARPLMVYHFGLDQRVGVSAMQAHRMSLELWVHDHKGDYFRIEQILKRAQAVLEALSHQQEFYECRWVSTSRDLEDLDMETIVKLSTFNVTLNR